MSKQTHTAQQYWDVRSDLFASYYKKPSLFDKLFRQGIYTRTAVALKTIQEYDKPTVLDIGSGPGVNSVTWLKNSNASLLLGIDFAESMNEYARKNAKSEALADRCKFIEGDFMKHKFDQSFDISVAVGVLDYIDDAASFIKKMDAVTNKAFVVSWPKNGLRMALRRYRYTCAVFHYTEKSIRDLHANCNIKSIDFIPTNAGWVTIARKK
ncbi:Methyltransferase domain-containing protein [Chitinophaga sp. CF118]|uniref:class I SAM-dependent methyltransferase n=1 Tax=Chitinophaga sp. CF118 TaxID=1884367 RepID=UPI0008F3272D|nr:class I SAM-dependent methyltransferase [Chitinophaga sp. CF118]SFD80349.1 Methyltransferase domain-containing protein [Chitinophaga sp. CF118]